LEKKRERLHSERMLRGIEGEKRKRGEVNVLPAKGRAGCLGLKSKTRRKRKFINGGGGGGGGRERKAKTCMPEKVGKLGEAGRG